MPGANYMGGKRNAAKARSRDAIGRTQKNHFGRQRMQSMLSKAFVAPALASPSSRPIPQFDLEHARRDFLHHGEPSLPRTAEEEHIEQPFTPKRSDGTMSSSHGSTSKVLRAMDKDEPLFLRATMDRILDLPDLVGLRTLHKKTNRTRAAPQTVRPLSPLSDGLELINKVNSSSPPNSLPLENQIFSTQSPVIGNASIPVSTSPMPNTALDSWPSHAYLPSPPPTSPHRLARVSSLAHDNRSIPLEYSDIDSMGLEYGSPHGTIREDPGMPNSPFTYATPGPVEWPTSPSTSRSRLRPTLLGWLPQETPVSITNLDPPDDEYQFNQMEDSCQDFDNLLPLNSYSISDRHYEPYIDTGFAYLGHDGHMSSPSPSPRLSDYSASQVSKNPVAFLSTSEVAMRPSPSSNSSLFGFRQALDNSSQSFDLRKPPTLSIAPSTFVNLPTSCPQTAVGIPLLDQSYVNLLDCSNPWQAADVILGLLPAGPRFKFPTDLRTEDRRGVGYDGPPPPSPPPISWFAVTDDANPHERRVGRPEDMSVRNDRHGDSESLNDYAEEDAKVVEEELEMLHDSLFVSPPHPVIEDVALARLWPSLPEQPSSGIQPYPSNLSLPRTPTPTPQEHLAFVSHANDGLHEHRALQASPTTHEYPELAVATTSPSRLNTVTKVSPVSAVQGQTFVPFVLFSDDEAEDDY